MTPAFYIPSPLLVPASPWSARRDRAAVGRVSAAQPDCARP